MIDMSKKAFWLSGLVALGAAVVGCEAADEDEVEVHRQAIFHPELAVAGFPRGLTCGLSYLGRNGVRLDDRFCKGARTLDTNPPAQFHGRSSIGDRGMPSGAGFWSQPYAGDVAANRFPANLRLIRGAACGFKESCNNSGELCDGQDPFVSCPAGWVQHVSRDANSGCSFAWCSYVDPNEICCNPNPGDTCDHSCSIDNVPSGTVCGIGDIEKGDGVCGGFNSTKGTCPPGYQRSNSAYDDGRNAGNGLAWCFRQ